VWYAVEGVVEFYENREMESWNRNKK